MVCYNFRCSNESKWDPTEEKIGWRKSNFIEIFFKIQVLNFLKI